jgi:glycosyltransferase involved in cell wall biosynthesis
MKTKILILGSFILPDKTASAIRVRGLGHILSELGYEVIFLGNNTDNNEKKDYFYTDKYKCFYNKPNSPKSYIDIEREIKVIKEINISDLYSIIAYHEHSVKLIRLNKFCRANGIKLICDQTEWYSFKRQLRRIFSFKSIDFLLRHYWVQQKVKNLIVISRYLENYYSKKNMNLVRIPNVVFEDHSRDNWSESSGVQLNKMNLNYVYSGSNSKKELLEIGIKAFSVIRKDNTNITLHVLGLTKSDFLKRYKKNKKITLDGVIFYGRLERHKTLDILSQADFSIILRANERYAKAGFPTKMMESLMLGIPIICNVIGDMNLYLTNDMNCIEIFDLNIKEIYDAFAKSIEMSKEQIRYMKKKSLEISLEELNYRFYLSKMKEFLSKAV